MTYVGRTKIYDKLYSSLVRQSVEYEMAVNQDEGKSRFDVLLPDSVLIQREFNKFSGTMNPRTLISYLHKAIRDKGNVVNYNSEVNSINYDDSISRYIVKVYSLPSGKIRTISAKNIVCAAGPYNGMLLKDIAPYFETLITPKRVFLAYLKIKSEKYNELSADEKNKLKSFYPVINSSKGTRDGSFFSMIEYYDEELIPVIKIGGHFQRSNIDDLDQNWSK